MIKSMDLRIESLKVNWGHFNILDFAGERIILSAGMENRHKNVSGEFFSLAEIEKIYSSVKKPYMLVTGNNIHDEILIELIRKCPDMKIYISAGRYSSLRQSIENKSSEAAREGLREEANAIKAVLNNLICHECGDKFEIGSVFAKFVPDGAMLGSAAAFLSHGEDSLLVSEGNVIPEPLLDLSGKCEQKKPDVLFMDICSDFSSFDEQYEPVSYEKLAEEINAARQNTSNHFFIPADRQYIPLVIKSLNYLQEKEIISREIRICPVGTEAKDILRLYEEKGIRLNYVSAYLNTGVDPEKLSREVGFRIFIVPGGDLSDSHQFSARVFRSVKSSSQSYFAYPAAYMPKELSMLNGKPEDQKCHVLCCDLTGMPDKKAAVSFAASYQPCRIILSGRGREYMKDILPDSYILPDGDEKLHFYKKEDGKIFAVSSFDTDAIAVITDEDLHKWNLDSAESIIAKIDEREKSLNPEFSPRKNRKIIFMTRRENLHMAETLHNTALDADIPSEIIISGSNIDFVKAISAMIEEYNDISFLSGGDIMMTAWVRNASLLAEKKLWYIDNGKAMLYVPVPLPLQENILDACWGNVRKIESHGIKGMENAVPEHFLKAVLHKDEKGICEYTENGILLDMLFRIKGKKGSISPVNMNSGTRHDEKHSPKAAVIMAYSSLVEYYCKAKSIPADRIEGLNADVLADFIRECAPSYKGSCHELETLFSLEDPAMLGRCEKIAIFTADDEKCKMSANALEKFFAGLGIETEIYFTEPFEDGGIYGLDDSGIRNTTSALAGLKRRYGDLIFLFCGGYSVYNIYASLAAMLFKDPSYIFMGGDYAEKLPDFPLDYDISKYVSARTHMCMIEDLNLSEKYDKIPDKFKNTVISRNDGVVYFTALQPILEALAFIRFPNSDFRQGHEKNRIFMVGGGKGHAPRPFFILKKAGEDKK